MGNIKESIKVISDIFNAESVGISRYVSNLERSIRAVRDDMRTLREDSRTPYLAIDTHDGENQGISPLQYAINQISMDYYGAHNGITILLSPGTYTIDKPIDTKSRHLSNSIIRFKGTTNKSSDVILNINTGSFFDYDGELAFENMTLQKTDTNKKFKITARKFRSKNVKLVDPVFSLYNTSDPNGFYIEDCVFETTRVTDISDYYSLIFDSNNTTDSYIRNTIFDFKTNNSDYRFTVEGIHDFSNNTILTSGNNLPTVTQEKNFVFNIISSNVTNCNIKIYNSTPVLSLNKASCTNNKFEYITNTNLNGYNPNDSDDDLLLHPLLTHISVATNSNANNNVFDYQTQNNFPHQISVVALRASSFNFNTIISSKKSNLSTFEGDSNSQCINSFLDGDVSSVSKDGTLIKL